MPQDLTGWLTKREVATRLGVSTKAIERWTHAGKLEQQFRSQAGSPAVSVYFPEDVIRLEAERAARPFVVGAAVPANGSGATGLVVPPASSGLSEEALAKVLGSFMATFQKPPSQMSQTARYLTIDEAAIYLGWPTRDIRHAIKSGELPAKKTIHNGWRIARYALDQL